MGTPPKKNQAPKHMKQTLIEMKEETESSIIF
jgi:hypothetical protein